MKYKEESLAHSHLLLNISYYLQQLFTSYLISVESSFSSLYFFIVG